MGVEIAKKFLGIGFSTGDVYVFPLIVGMSIGAGWSLSDGAGGSYLRESYESSVGGGFWGRGRHPTQLYDIVFLWLPRRERCFLIRMRWPYPNGKIFRLFIFGYCLYRLAVEFIKPTYRVYLGLSAIQVACVVVALVCGWLLQAQMCERNGVAI